jgi:hypothetical protein
MKFFLIIAFYFLLASTQAHGFPEMVRMGYQNCVACHISPTGGGVLTPYGRGMSSEVLSTWHYEGEEAIGHGLIAATPEWLQFGGDSRWIQTYVNNLQATQTQWFPMQNQIEAAVKVMKVWLVGNLDFEGGPPGTPNLGMLFNNRLYALTNFTDEFYARAGRYLLPFGINQPNHTAVTAQNLGWGQEVESDNIEAGYIGEKINAILTGDFGRPDNSSLQYEKGAALNFSYNLMTSHKLGFSAFAGTSYDNKRFVTGPYAILGLFNKLVFMSQADLQWRDQKDPASGPEQQGFVTFNRVQYEIAKGLHPYVIHQISYLNTQNVSSRFDSYGGGLIWYPRPHFELWGEWQKIRSQSVADIYTDSAWLVLHYYL